MLNNMDISPQKIGIIGATGLVGTEMIKVLEKLKFPVAEFRAFASPRSVGKDIKNPWGQTKCQELNETCFDGLDIVIVDVDDPIAAKWVPIAAAAGVKVVDKSAHFRMEADVPLVIPEINGSDIKTASRNIVSNPNCTTSVMLMALYPLYKEWGIERIVVSTYQAVSGAGIGGIGELEDQLFENVKGETYQNAATNIQLLEGGNLWNKRIASNVIPLAGSIQESGYTSEEMKLVKETQKILHDESIQVAATCVRVPVFMGHSLSMSVTFKETPSVSKAQELIKAAPGVQVQDAPTALESAGIDDVLVGRIRKDLFLDNTLNLWTVGDNIIKGAALNAGQIAQVWCAN
jgi:aspartate-semialdehyde dehydrogenase